MQYHEKKFYFIFMENNKRNFRESDLYDFTSFFNFLACCENDGFLCYFIDMCDEVMETAWSTMWNITDETPVNCKRFLDRGGTYMEILKLLKTSLPD